MTRGMTRVLSLMLLVLALALPAVPAAAQDFATAEEEAFVEAINASRAQHGLGALTLNTELRDISRGWTVRLVEDQRLSHNPSYTQQYTGEWERMAENVGYTSWRGSAQATVARMHDAFMNSSGHRANILGDHNQVSVGVLYDGGDKLWVTVNFLKGPVPEQRRQPARSHFTRGTR